MAVDGLLAQLFAYVDRPWKVAAVIALLVVGGAGLVLYEQRDALIEAWLTPAEPELKLALVPAALEKLVSESDADLVQIWLVDLEANAQSFVAARRRDGERPVIPNPRRLPVITTASDAKALVDVLNGHPICIDITASGSPLARRLADRGMRRGCAIPIPPTGEAFVGVIYLAWSAPPDSGAESVAVGAARAVARELARR
jgi:hypothetical protein